MQQYDINTSRHCFPEDNRVGYLEGDLRSSTWEELKPRPNREESAAQGPRQNPEAREDGWSKKGGRVSLVPPY